MRLLLALALMLAATAVWADSVRTDAAAFGDWRGDGPAVARKITPEDLPPPLASGSSARSPSVIVRPAAAEPHVPNGFEVALFATGLDEPRTMRTAPNGDVFIAESGAHPEPRLAGARADLAAHVTVPDVLIQPHSAPLGIVFYDGTLFPPEYRGDAFVALHGSWNRSLRTGYKVVRLRFQDGRPTGVYEDFLSGFVASDQAVWGRPVGLIVAHDGSLPVSEDSNGTIWRVSYRMAP